MNRKIMALWVISFLTVSSAKAQFNTVSDKVCRYKVKKVEKKFLLPASYSVDSITANLPQQETDSVDSKQKQWTSCYLSITYPLKSIKVTSPYGYRRDPFTGKQSWHNGIDLTAHNAIVYSMFPGTVERVGYDSRSGNFVAIRHSNFRISYCHLSQILVTKEQSVLAGFPIGITGSTGRSTGEHLHITVKYKEKTFNPMTMLEYVYSKEKLTIK